MSDYFCDKCLGYKGTTILGHPHQCPPAWEGTDYESETEDPWQYGITVYAHTPEEAAEKWCQRADQMGDYDIISAGGADLVRVRKVDTAEEFRFRVVAESEPVYSARTAWREAADWIKRRQGIPDKGPPWCCQCGSPTDLCGCGKRKKNINRGDT